MKIERLLALTIMLLNRKRVTAKELSDYFGVTIRTIYRDIDTLIGSGIPVVSYQGFEGGYCISDNYKLSRQLLTFDDILSLLSLLKGVNQTLQNRDVDLIIEKITALIPVDREVEYERESNSFVLDISPWGCASPSALYLTDLQRSISYSHRISITYISSQGIISQRVVEPYTLIYKDFNWYLLGFCALRNEFRLFKVTRFSECTVLEERFVRQPFDPRKWLSSGVDTRPCTKMTLQFTLSSLFKVKELFALPLIDVRDNAIYVEISVPFDEWIIGMILSFGDAVTVIEPLEIRNIVYQKIVAMQKKYE